MKREKTMKYSTVKIVNLILEQATTSDTHTRTCLLFVQVEQMQVHTPGLLSNRCWCSARAARPCA